MATTRGCFGKVKADTIGGGSVDVMAEVRNWSYEETAEQLDASAIGDCTKKFVAGAKQTTGQFQTWWDPADTAQAIFQVGDEVELELYPGGDSSGSTYYETGTSVGAGAIITSVSRTGGVDGIVENNFGFTVNGELTTSTVP